MIVRCPIQAAAEVAPNAEAIVFADRRVTYGELEAEVQAWTAHLGERGVQEGDRVCTLAWNRPELVTLWFALLRLRAVLIPLNARLKTEELEELLALAKPKALFGDVSPPLPQGEGFPTLESARRATEPAAILEPARTAAILFTSGTTGHPKGAQLTVGNFLANAEGSKERIGGAPEHRWLGSLPLFHVGGLSMAFKAAWYGATLVLMRRFEPETALRLLDTERITHASFVPTTLSRLLGGGARAGRSLRAALIGGGPVSAELLQRARAAGIPALQTYGLTEACAQVCTESPTDDAPGTAGRPLVGTEVRVVDEARRPVASGVAGEIEVRGPTVMAGYFEADRGVAADGWLATRDWGSLDARGRLTVYARRTDLILTGGENVYPAELEAVIATHPEIRDVAVTAMADPEWGQVPVAVIAGRAEVEEAELARWCRERLAGFKVPKRFVAVGEVPRNANGKVDRAALRTLIAAAASAGSGAGTKHEQVR